MLVAESVKKCIIICTSLIQKLYIFNVPKLVPIEKCLFTETHHASFILVKYIKTVMSHTNELELLHIPI